MHRVSFEHDADSKKALWIVLQTGAPVRPTCKDGKNIVHHLSDTEILVNGTSKIDRSIIDLCPKLLLVHQAGIGYDNVDVEYCTSKSIFVANVPIANAISVAEHALFLMMSLAKNMYVASGTLMKRRNPRILGMELHGKTLLIVGLGASGTEVAKRAKSFGMNVIAVTKDPVGYKLGREKLFSLMRLDRRMLCVIAFLDQISYHSMFLSLRKLTV